MLNIGFFTNFEIFIDSSAKIMEHEQRERNKQARYFFFDDTKCHVSLCVGYIKSNSYRSVYFSTLLNSSPGCYSVI